MRFVVYGVGAVGSVFAVSLVESGYPVIGIARGQQLVSLQERSLRVRLGEGVLVASFETVATPQEVTFESGDVVLLTVKSQHTECARQDLREAAPVDTPVVCVQNGVSNELSMLRSFRNVYGAVLRMRSIHLGNRLVSVPAGPPHGSIELGRYPSGIDPTAEAISSVLKSAGFESRTNPEVMKAKYEKLIANLATGIEAVCGPAARGGELEKLVVEEAIEVSQASGMHSVALVAMNELRGIEDHGRPAESSGMSSWQSLKRSAGSIETDFLNGEIVRLGRHCGIPTPANETIQTLANDLARDSLPPGAFTESEVLHRIE